MLNYTAGGKYEKKLKGCFKTMPKETYDEVIKRLMNHHVAEDHSKETKEVISKGLKDVESGKVFSTDEVKRKLFRKRQK